MRISLHPMHHRRAGVGCADVRDALAAAVEPHSLRRLQARRRLPAFVLTLGLRFAMPSRCRSNIISRSNCAIAANMFSISRPVAPRVSTASPPLGEEEAQVAIDIAKEVKTFLQPICDGQLKLERGVETRLAPRATEPKENQMHKTTIVFGILIWGLFTGAVRRTHIAGVRSMAAGAVAARTVISSRRTVQMGQSPATVVSAARTRSNTGPERRRTHRYGMRWERGW